MFTGLVQATGRVVASRPAPGGRRLEVDAAAWAHRPAPGDSISVSGCCLTLAEPAPQGVLVFNVVPETLTKTTLARLTPGALVNLEPALRAGDPLGGHFVQGHVDGVGVVQSIALGAEHLVTIRPPQDIMAYITPRGSVCVDGISLTIARLDPAAGTFGVALIPTTLAITTLGSLRAGDQVNLEADMLAKTMVHYLRHYAPSAR